MKLLQVDTLQEAREKLLQAAGQLSLQTETVPLAASLGRILAQDVRTEELLYVFSDDEAFPAVVDLLVFSDDFNLVVDYKSDKMLSPEIHKNQVVGYVRALEDVYRKKCYGTLYYMRDKDAVTPFWDKDGNTVSPEP